MVNERTDLLKAGEPLPRHLTDDGIIDELSNLVFAGTDTTGNTLAYLFWRFAHHPEWALKLRTELKSTYGAHPEHMQHDQLAELPVLDAILQETFRVHPAAIGGLQRLVPEGGACISGVSVPGGVSLLHP